MSTYAWKVISTDEDQGTMVVEYTHGAKVEMLNLPLPLADETIDVVVDRYAPRASWETRVFAQVQAGDEGTGVAAVEVPAPAQASQTPNTVGSFNEEYIRALIYQVLEEIKDATV